MPSANIPLSDEDHQALKALADAEGRSCAATVRMLIRKAAAAKGLWQPPVTRTANAGKPLQEL